MGNAVPPEPIFNFSCQPGSGVYGIFITHPPLLFRSADCPAHLKGLPTRRSRPQAPSPPSRVTILN
jgi:hypothetical protein